ncbi:MAG: hypothetical protein WHT65_02960 [Pseudothermotoga sp.]
MNKLVLAILLISSSLLAVGYYFEQSHLIITGVESYDSLKITIDQITFEVDAKNIRIPWQKGTEATVKLTPVKNGKEQTPIELKINATKDQAPKLSLSVPTYLPADRTVLPFSLIDDWDDLSTLKVRAYVDGKRTDVLENRSIVIDTFLLHSGEHRLRIVCRDSSSNVVDKTYRFTVVPQIPQSPNIQSGKILSDRTHRIYYMENSEMKQKDLKNNQLDTDFSFVCDLDGAGNESLPVLHYSMRTAERISAGNLITFSSGVLQPGEYNVFGRVVIPSSEMVLLKQNTTLKIPQGCELIVKGTLIAESGSKIVGYGKLTIADEGRVAFIGAKIETNVAIAGACMVWISNTDLSKATVTITRAVAISLKDVRAQMIELTNVARLWINSSDIGKLLIRNTSQFVVKDSKLNQLNVSSLSKGRLYSTSLYSQDLPLIVSNLSVVELIDSWISGSKCVQVQDYSILRARSTEFTGDVAVTISGYSVFNSFANKITSTTAMYVKDSRVRLSKTEFRGEVVKVGRSEILSM